MDIKTQVQGLDPNVRARNIKQFLDQSTTIYEALAVISKRARQVSVDLKQELHNKLDEFATSSETIEEVIENKEQIEISKFYERLPNPVIIAVEEYLTNDLHFRYAERRKQEE